MNFRRTELNIGMSAFELVKFPDFDEPVSIKEPICFEDINRLMPGLVTEKEMRNMNMYNSLQLGFKYVGMVALDRELDKMTADVKWPVDPKTINIWSREKYRNNQQPPEDLA